MRCTNFAGTGEKQLARQNDGRDSDAGGSVPVGKREGMSQRKTGGQRDTGSTGCRGYYGEGGQ